MTKQYHSIIKETYLHLAQRTLARKAALLKIILLSVFITIMTPNVVFAQSIPTIPIAATIPLGDGPVQVIPDSTTNSIFVLTIEGEDAIWALGGASTDRSIKKIDLTTNAIIADISLGASNTSLTHDPSTGSLWLSSGSTYSATLQKMDLDTGQIIETVSVPNVLELPGVSGPIGFSYDPVSSSMWGLGGVWSGNAVGGIAQPVYKFNPQTKDFSGSFTYRASISEYFIGGMSGDSVWVANVISGGHWRALSKLDLVNHTIGTTIDFGLDGGGHGASPSGAAIDPSNNTMWVTSVNTCVTQKVDLTTNTIVATINGDLGPLDCAFSAVFVPADNSVWTIGYSGIIRKINTHTNTVEASVTVGSFPYFGGLVFDSNSNSIWAFDTFGKRLIKISAPLSGKINVSANVPGASWTITGPATITGSGTSQTSTSKPTGTYTINWGSVSGYTAPTSQSLTLTSGGTITFSGTYAAVVATPSIAACDTPDITLTNGQVWQACNVGATTAYAGQSVNFTNSTATGGPTAEQKSYMGAYFQWGRNDDVTTGATTTTLAPSGTTANSVGHSKIILSNSLPYDWILSQNNNLWGGATTSLVSGTFADQTSTNQALMQGPCTIGYHVPTQKEWCDAFATIAGKAGCDIALPHIDTTFRTTLKLPLAGFRSGDTTGAGAYYTQGTFGSYWASSPLVEEGYAVSIESSRAQPLASGGRNIGSSIRCIKNSTVTQSSCSASSASWGSGCSGSYSAITSGGSPTTITNTASGKTGSVTLSCANGTISQSAASCAPIAGTPLACGSAATTTTEKPINNLCSSGATSGTVTSTPLCPANPPPSPWSKVGTSTRYTLITRTGFTSTNDFYDYADGEYVPCSDFTDGPSAPDECYSTVTYDACDTDTSKTGWSWMCSPTSGAPIACFAPLTASPPPIPIPISPSGTPVWGQGYSPNAGYINFYCSAGAAKPSFVNANAGVSTLTECAAGTDYGVRFDKTTQKFSGKAYSSNYGWLDLTDVALPDITLSDGTLAIGNALSGNTTFGNFGTTYFGSGEPNANAPGVTYDTVTNKICGFAYSTTAGYIALCDPNGNINYPAFTGAGFDYDGTGFDYNTYLDITPPILIPASIPLTASNRATVLRNWTDTSNLKSVKITVDGAFANSPATYDSTAPVSRNPTLTAAGAFSFTHDFSEAKSYGMTWTACDNFDNCTTQTETEFFKVIAGPPVTNTTSVFTFGSPVKIADGSETHYVEFNLKDTYGNPVKTVSGVRKVQTRFYFDNTTWLDQISKTGIEGNAAKYSINDDKLYNYNAYTSYGNMVFPSPTTVLEEKETGDGIYHVDVASYSPTSNAFPAIASAGFKLDFNHARYRVTPVAPYTDAEVGGTSWTEVNVTATTATDPDGRFFAFKPAVLSTPVALDCPTISTCTESTGAKNIAINSVKRFKVSVKNESTNASTSTNELGFVLTTNNTYVTWQDVFLEKAQGTAFSGHGLGISTITAAPTWNPLPTDAGTTETTPINTLNTSAEKFLVISATPRLSSGTSVGGSVTTDFKTYVGYTIDGKHIRHIGNGLAGSSSSGGGGTTSPAVTSSGIEIIGSVRSLAGTRTINTTSRVGATVGDMTNAELKNQINVSVSKITNGSTTSSSCTSNTTLSGRSTANAKEFATPSGGTPSLCTLMDGGVLFFDGADVTFEDTSDGIVTLPTGAHTLVIRDGNLKIKSNIVYGSGSVHDSFGVIMLRSDTATTDVHLYPNVTNVAMALYTEGSLISVDTAGSSDIFDRGLTLRNQLLWNGLIVSQNTIGGYDPSGISQCPQSISACDDATAQILDLNYLRTFTYDDTVTPPAYSGTRAGYDSDNATDNSLLPNPPTGDTHATIVKYDSRIKSNPPPLFGNEGTTTLTPSAY